MSAQPATPLPANKTLNDVRKLDQLYSRAVEARDVETLLSFYDPNATVLPPHHPVVRNQEELRQLFTGYTQAGIERFNCTTTRIEESGDLVVAVGTYDMRVQGKEDRGKFTATFRRNKKGELRFIVDTWNSDLPPTP